MNGLSIDQEPKDRSVILYIMAAVLTVAVAAAVLVIRYQSANPPPSSKGPIVIPGMLRPGDPDFEYYKNKIRLEGVKASLGINFAQSRIAIVDGIISNEGDRKLEALELHVALYDVYNQLSKERTATPLRPGVGIKRPMQPMEKQPFTIFIEPIEQLWNPKRLEIEITGLKYQ